MLNLPPPPVPQKLREMLKDYPELIQELQDTLDSYVKKPNRSLPFDGALWLLEDALSSFMSEARAELNIAEASGDARAIARAKEKRSIMGIARSNMGGMSDLLAYFDAHQEAFE